MGDGDGGQTAETRNQKSETRSKSECRKEKIRKGSPWGFGIHASGFLLVSDFWFLVWPCSHRQMHLKIRPLPHLAGDTDPPAVFFGDAFGHGQAQAGAGALGGVVGVEDFGELVGGDAGAGVD